MSGVFLGLLATAAGLLLCFWGRVVLRLVIAVWAAVAGFNLGAGLLARVTREPFLGSPSQWVAGVVVALVFAALAYAFFAAGVVLAVGSIGFAVAATAIVALGVDWSWGALGVAVVVGVLAAVVAIVSNLPSLLLVVLSAVSGASVAVTGAMLLAGVMAVPGLTVPALVDGARNDWWWYALVVLLAVAGVAFQARSARGARRRARRDGRPAAGSLPLAG